MIRSGSIPPVLNRICDNNIHSALLVTPDGELMGVSSNFNNNNTTTTTTTNHHNTTSNNNNNNILSDPEAIGTLLADIGVDYQKLGQELRSSSSSSNSNSNNNNHLQCLLMELDLGMIGISSCSLDGSGGGSSGMDDYCLLVIAIAKPETPPGLLKAKLLALAAHVQESFSPLTEGR